jgi:hypothetical protein
MGAMMPAGIFHTPRLEERCRREFPDYKNAAGGIFRLLKKRRLKATGDVQGNGSECHCSQRV